MPMDCDGHRRRLPGGTEVLVHYVKSVNLKGLSKRAGTDFPAEELDKILKTESALHDIAQLYHKNHVPGKQAIMFCHSIKQAVLMQEILSDRYKV